jgi:hypothetical protein
MWGDQPGSLVSPIVGIAFSLERVVGNCLIGAAGKGLCSAAQHMVEEKYYKKQTRSAQGVSERSRGNLERERFLFSFLEAGALAESLATFLQIVNQLLYDRHDVATRFPSYTVCLSNDFGSLALKY